MNQQELTNKQFGDMAMSYLVSTVHAKGEDLERLSSLVSKLRPTRALDIGCGAGHASYAMAAGGASGVVAYDLSGQMLSVVANEAKARALDQITTKQGTSNKLPFSDGSFEFVATRFSAHHWFDMNASLAEIARVLSPGGTLVVIDIVSPETSLYDTVLQTIEFLRDNSHVRNYRVSEWEKMLFNYGFSTIGHNRWKLHIEFESWTARISTSPDLVKALHTTLDGLSEEAKCYFGVGEDYSFNIDSAWIHAVRNTK